MILFNIVMSFGVNVLLYANAMGNVNPALIESASLEGANTFSILWHVV
ncbi:MAG TPA: ABC transporter permease, partial [Firmicutes bacterium]|nr:ABC transporter permease [Bacillota bacterium]